MEQLLTREETQKQLGGVSDTTLWRLEQRKALVPVRIGSRVFYRPRDVQAFIDSLARPKRGKTAEA